MNDEGNTNLGNALGEYNYSYWRAFFWGDFFGMLNPKLITHVAVHENGVILTRRDGAVHRHLYSDLAMEIAKKNLGGGLVGLGANLMASDRDKVAYYQLRSKNGNKVMNITSSYKDWHSLGETLSGRINQPSKSDYYSRLGKL